jgi:hypothetical protein
MPGRITVCRKSRGLSESRSPWHWFPETLFILPQGQIFNLSYSRGIHR